MTDDMPPIERLGTQAERTELAWVRTTLACAGLAVLAVQLAGDGLGLPGAVALGLLVATPGLAVSWRRLRGLRARPVPDPPRTIHAAALAGSVVLVDLLVLLLVLT